MKKEACQVLATEQIPEWKTDPLFLRWTDTILNDGTKESYTSWFSGYIEFTKLSPTQLIDEAIEDSKLDYRQKKDIVMKRLISFYRWLKTDYQKKPQGKDKTKKTGKGVTDKTASARVGAVRSFYATFGVTVRMKGRHRIPRAEIVNKRILVNSEQVKTLVNHARTARDRAIILVNFQGGFDAETLCNLKYGDVAEGLKNDENPLRLDVFRKKNRVKYHTFLGRDAIEALKVYISDAKSRGVNFNYDMPLFLKHRGKGGKLSTNLIQHMMKVVAFNAGFINSKNNGNSFNPLGSHALRESFGSIMINSGVPDTIVDFWLGHRIGEMSKAYKSVQSKNLRKMYMERENLLSFSVPDVKEIDRKIKMEIHEENIMLHTSLLNLRHEGAEMRKDLDELQKENKSLRKLWETEKEEIFNEIEDKLEGILEKRLAEAGITQKMVEAGITQSEIKETVKKETSEYISPIHDDDPETIWRLEKKTQGTNKKR